MQTKYHMINKGALTITFGIEYKIKINRQSLNTSDLAGSQ